MNVYLYLDYDTIIHRLDPRTKMLLLIVAFALSVLFQHPSFVFGMTVLIFIHTTISRSWVNVFRLRALIFLISVMGIILWSLYAGGETNLFWRFKLEPFLYGLGTSIKLASMIIAGITFLSTTTNEEVSHGLIRLGLPFSVAFTISTALRLVPTFAGTGATIVEAQRSRGLNLQEGNLFSRMRKYIPLLVPVFLLAIRGTDNLSIALESKGFRARDKQTFVMDIGFGRNDYLIITAVLILLGLASYLRWAGFGLIPGLTVF